MSHGRTDELVVLSALEDVFVLVVDDLDAVVDSHILQAAIGTANIGRRERPAAVGTRYRANVPLRSRLLATEGDGSPVFLDVERELRRNLKDM